MGKLCGKIRIELRSDLCAGSGYSYAGVIDSDVSYDEYGLPFIPARRLKGCLRESAEMVCKDAVAGLFGTSGDNGAKGIRLGNGRIEEYDLIVGELEKLRGTKRTEAYFLTSQNILNMYTGIRAQIKINEDTNVAEKNSLRYTRIVGQYNPLKSNEFLCFYAKIEFEDVYEEQLSRIAKATRNIGMNRNRGLGSVRCSLIDISKDEMPESIPSNREGEDERICLTYVLRNQEPLVLSSDNTEVSDSYISGKSILGNLAGAYLRKEGKNADGKEFRELFLDGTTLFSNAYLTVPDKEGIELATLWPDYYPAPLYLNRLKKTKALINNIGDNKDIPSERKKEYDTQDGNLPKKLKTHYVHEQEPNVFNIVEPEREILYHNSRMELLYSQEALKEGQYFKGKIYTTRKHAYLLNELLKNTQLSFGKSKTAQYGACVLAAESTVENIKGKLICAKDGERVAVVMDSDTIFLDETGGYTVRFEEVKKLVGEHFAIPYDQTVDEGSAIQTKEVTGYNTTWNLRRPGVPAVKAGSVLVYTIPFGQNWQQNPDSFQLFVGERNLDGYGQVRILKCRDMDYAAQSADEFYKEPNSEKEEALCLNRCTPFLLRIATEQLLERLTFLYSRGRSELKLSASTVGRLNLMLQESLNEYRNEPEQALEDFCSRINSIKRKREKEEALRLLCSVILVDESDKGEYKIDVSKMTEYQRDSKLQEIWKCMRLYAEEDECRKKLADIWGIYVGNILTYHKYLKKHEGGSEEYGE